MTFQLHGFKKSSHRIFRLNNIAKVLSFLEERNVSSRTGRTGRRCVSPDWLNDSTCPQVKLVSIDAADVADGNASIILGLIWNIILFFQVITQTQPHQHSWYQYSDQYSVLVRVLVRVLSTL